MKKRTKHGLLILAGVVAVFVVAVVGFAAYFIYTFPSFNEYPHQSDEIMLTRFQEHRAEFEQLKAMAESDDLMWRVDNNWTDPVNLPSDRVADYRRLFNVVGTPRGVSKYRAEGHILFIVSTQGWVASGSSKGYLYSKGKRPAGNFVDSLNDEKRLRELDIYFLRPIEGDWYLFFQRS
jgi:hypothetical protein